MIAIINTSRGAKNFVQSQVLPISISYFGDSMTNSHSFDYPNKVYGINGITKTNYGVSGGKVCTSSYAPTGGSTDLIDLYSTEIALGYTGQLVSFAYLVNDATIANVTWKSVYKGILQDFINAGFPVTRLLLMNEPSILSSQAGRAVARQYILEISDELGILYFDVNQRFLDTGVNDSLFQDTLHPNSAGNDVWAQGYFTYLRR